MDLNKSWLRIAVLVDYRLVLAIVVFLVIVLLKLM